MLPAQEKSVNLFRGGAPLNPPYPQGRPTHQPRMRAHAWAWGAQAWGLAERADHLAWGVGGCEGVAGGGKVAGFRRGRRNPANVGEAGGAIFSTQIAPF